MRFSWSDGGWKLIQHQGLKAKEQSEVRESPTRSYISILGDQTAFHQISFQPHPHPPSRPKQMGALWHVLFAKN